MNSLLKQMGVMVMFWERVVSALSCNSGAPHRCPSATPRGLAHRQGLAAARIDKDGEGAGQEEILDRHDNLTVARAIYRGRVAQYPGRLVMLCDRARVLARSDRPETMP